MSSNPRISLAMIVRDEEEGLARCLSSVADGVDEIIIVDTGSVDGTEVIARQFTPLVFDIPWEDNFSTARQFAFDRADGDWILFLDGDDELTGAANLHEICAAAADDVGALRVHYVTGWDSRGNVTQQFWRERLVRSGQYRWKGAAHEVLVPVIPNRQQETDRVIVHHHGKRGRGLAGLERNVRLLKGELERQGDTPDSRTLFYLARDTMLLGAKARALGLFLQYLRVATWREEIYQAWLFVAHLHLQLGGSEKAQRAALEAIGVAPAWPQAYFALAEIAYYRSDWPRVVDWCELGRTRPTPQQSLFVDPLGLDYAWIIYYANALYHLSDVKAARAWTQRALQVVPDSAQHQHNLQFFDAILGTASARAMKSSGSGDG